jgi:hypothetical protein
MNQHIILYSGDTFEQFNGVLTQELMEAAYRNLCRIVRFESGVYEYLVAHKWRSEGEGGGWDNDKNWKASWVPLPKKVGGEFRNPLY